MPKPRYLFQIWLSEDEWNALNTTAQNNDQTRTQFIRDFIRKGMLLMDPNLNP